MAKFFLILYSFLLISGSLVTVSCGSAAYAQDYSPRYHYSYRDRSHSSLENLSQLGLVYFVSWVIYPLTQPGTFKEEGSWKNYRKNFGKVVFDNDRSYWNWLIHPLSGGYLYLYYRANGYAPINSLAMSFISSALFEFTIEIYTEPASVQDLYQTPILGAVVGWGLEKVSLSFLNSRVPLLRIVGHILNPFSLFGFFEGRVRVSPFFKRKGANGLALSMEF